MKRVRTGRVIVALVGGVLLQVGVAWGLFVCRKAITLTTVGAVTLDPLDTYGSHPYIEGIEVPLGVTPNVSLGLNEYETWYGSEREPTDSERYLQNRNLHVHERRVGFPIESMTSVVAGTRTDKVFLGGAGYEHLTGGKVIIEYRTALDHGFTLHHSDVEFMGLTFSFQYIPYRPLPLGFAANTLIFGLLVYLGLAGLPAWRVRRRVRRGLCGGCGYDLSGLDACPECGLER